MAKIIDDLIGQMACLPGMTQRSAIRVIAHMLSHPEECLHPINNALNKMQQEIKKCEICWNFDITSPCSVCSGSNKRNRKQICVVENVGALWSIEKRRHYNGMYHILGGLLSAADGITPGSLNIYNLLRRIIESDENPEIIIAVQPSVPSAITMEYLIQAIREINSEVVISKIAQGLQSGTKIEGADDETIIAAFMSRVVVG